MKRFKPTLTFILLICISLSIEAQVPEAALDNVRNNYASEKIFIHYDKACYVAGETIWFKAYFLSGFLPSTLSTSISVDLVNDSGRVTDRKILPIINSVANGSFELPRNAGQKNYTVRAYTRYLMNFGKNSFYYQQIPLFNPSSQTNNSVPQKEFSFYLLPESGNLVAGINNVVAFKCTDQWGYPAEAKGNVINSSGAIITSFSSAHDGMGKFNVTPVAGETYTAVTRVGGASEINKILPAANASGTSLSIQKTNGKTYFVVNSETVFNENLQPAYILAVMEDAVIFKTSFPDGQKNFKGEIPVASIPGGIMQLTVFTKANQPLAERLLFINNQDYVAGGKLSTELVSTDDRAKNSYSFELADSLSGSFSVSVTAADKEIKQIGTDNIISRFLVTNDLKGYVHNPAYYFEGDEEERKNNLDLVMLTNGWRKFSWNEILSARLPSVTYKDAGYITLQGSAFDENSGKRLSETSLSVYIKTKDSLNDMIILPVTKEGTFNLPGLIFRDTATMFIFNSGSKNKRTVLQPATLTISALFNVASPSFMVSPMPLRLRDGTEKIKNLYSSVLSNLENKSILLSEVKLKANTKSATRLLEERYIKSALFSSYAAKTLDLVNDRNAANTSTNIFEYLKGRLSSVTITGSAGNYFINYRNSMNLSSGLLSMDLFLDEMPTSTLQVATIPVSQIALVKVFSSGFVGSAGNGPGGAMAIYTKRGDDTYNVTAMDNTFRLKLEGYSSVKEFFSPDHSSGKTATSNMDYRTTLYWDPYLQTDPSNKKISFSFFNADQVKKFKIVLEGMTADGKLVHVERLVE
ncbi:MAG: hypothetical protein H7258_14425 [Ferruginibacter sp.]|nr:hypothetical protein [Ferruginibacter sp.]